MPFSHKIGIIGGLGPFAGAYALEALFRQASHDYAALEDADFPDVLLHSIPFKGTSSTGIEHASPVRSALATSLKAMEASGVEYAILCCNSSHAYLEELTAGTHINLISLIDAALNTLPQLTSHRIRVLCARSARTVHLFDIALHKAGHNTCELSEAFQNRLDAVIRQGMQARITAECIFQFRELLNEASSEGKRPVILGCTELSRINALHPQLSKPALIIDSLEEALRLLLIRASGEGPL